MTRSLMSIGYTKSFGVKPQLDRYFHSISYQIILNNHEISSEMFRFVSIVRDNLCDTFSIFYHSLHIWYHDILSNFMIFGLSLFFIEFKNHSTTRSGSCFWNKMFETPYNLIGKASNWVE